MFNDLVISGANSTKTNKSWTVLVSTILQAAILGILILIPLIYTEALPKGMLTTFIVPPPPPPPPPPPAAAIQRIVKPVVHLIKNGQMMAPTVIPKKIEMIKEEATPPDAGCIGRRSWRRRGRFSRRRTRRHHRRRRWRATASPAGEGQRSAARGWQRPSGEPDSSWSSRFIRRSPRRRTSPARWSCTRSFRRKARSRNWSMSPVLPC